MTLGDAFLIFLVPSPKRFLLMLAIRHKNLNRSYTEKRFAFTKHSLCFRFCARHWDPTGNKTVMVLLLDGTIRSCPLCKSKRPNIRHFMSRFNI